jgi:hypothetical protein
MSFVHLPRCWMCLGHDALGKLAAHGLLENPEPDRAGYLEEVRPWINQDCGCTSFARSGSCETKIPDARREP